MNDVLNPIRVYVEEGPNETYSMVDHLRDLASRTHRVLSVCFLPERLGPARRLLAPAMNGWGHLALFLERRATIEGDVDDLFRQARKDPHRAVYVPEQEVASPWPSLMLFRAKYCTNLTPMFLQRATPEQLAPAAWAGGPQNVGTLTGIRVDGVA